MLCIRCLILKGNREVAPVDICHVVYASGAHVGPSANPRMRTLHFNAEAYHLRERQPQDSNIEASSTPIHQLHSITMAFAWKAAGITYVVSTSPASLYPSRRDG
jgi:hypothetical protein